MKYLIFKVRISLMEGEGRKIGQQRLVSFILEIFDKFAGCARNKRVTRKEKLYLHTPTLGRTFQQRSPINLHHSTVLHKPAQCRSGAH
jgi:hypothetical protein